MPMPTIAVSTSSFGRHDPRPLEKLREAGYEVRLNPHGRRLREVETTELLHGVVGLVANWVPAFALESGGAQGQAGHYEASSIHGGSDNLGRLVGKMDCP